jgi:hypothetical protein
MKADTFRSGLFDEADDKEQDARTDKCGDDSPDQSACGDPEYPEEPTSDNCADDTYDDVTDEAETAALHDHSGQPTGDGSDHKKDNDARDIHVSPFRFESAPLRKPKTLNLRHLSISPEGLPI